MSKPRKLKKIKYVQFIICQFSLNKAEKVTNRTSRSEKLQLLEMKIQWMGLKAKEKAGELEKRSEESNQKAAQRNKQTLISVGSSRFSLLPPYLLPHPILKLSPHSHPPEVQLWGMQCEHGGLVTVHS